MEKTIIAILLTLKCAVEADVELAFEFYCHNTEKAEWCGSSFYLPFKYKEALIRLAHDMGLKDNLRTHEDKECQSFFMSITN